MHIAFFLPDLRGGGAQKMVLNMAHEFAARGDKVDLVVASSEGVFAKELKNTVKLVDLKKTRTVLSVFALSRYLEKERPDIFVSALFHANLTAIMAKLIAGSTATKFILTERNYFSKRIEDSGYERFYIPLLARILYPHADMVIGISKGVADDIQARAKLHPAKTGWIHNPVVTPDMRGGQISANNNREKPVIITSGRLVEQKDHETLIKAFAVLVKKRPATLKILGTGPREQELKKLAADLGVTNDVIFEGFVENSLDHFYNADLFVISSQWEGFCNVIVEALLCGLPVVSTDCPSGPAEILDQEKFGILVPVRDESALAAAINNALDRSWDKKAQRGRAMDFTVEKICDSYAAVFREVMR